MKKSAKIFLVLTLALSVAFLGVHSAQAIIIPAPDFTWNDPTVSPNSPGTTLKTEVVEPSQLPGTNTNGKGMFEPVGFGLNQAQFGGNGIVVSGLPDGKTAKLCFSFPVYQFDWAGKIYHWNGTKWMMSSTTIIPGVEGTTTLACTNSVGNGTYALIIGFYGTPEVPAHEAF